MTRARSLSRLANTNAFTVDASQNVGIGSTLPDVRLDVNGDMNVTGTLTYEDVTNVATAGVTTTGGLVVTGLGATIGGITTFFGDLNFGAAGVGGTITTLGHAEFAGVVTATSFSGDGSALTGVASTENINTSTLAQFTGPVGIADSIFHIGDSNTAIRFPAADTFTVETAGAEAIRISSSGNVGINSTNPSGNNKLQIAGTGDDSAFVRLQRTNGAGDDSAYGGINVVDNNDVTIGSAEFRNQDSTTRSQFVLSTYNSGSLNEVIRVKGNGNVGINSTNPAYLLDIASSSASMRLNSTATSTLVITSGASSAARIEFGDLANNDTGYIYYDNSDDSMQFATNGSNERLRITAAGRVRHQNSGGETIHEMRRTDANTSGSVGTINFTASDSHSVASIGALGDGDNEGAHIVFRTTSAAADNSPYNAATPERVRINSSGDLIVDAGGDAQDIQIKSHSANSGHGIIYMRGNASNERSSIQLNHFGHADWLISAGATGNGEFSITNTDQGTDGIKLNTDGDLLPAADNSLDLGSTSLRWANIYSADLQLSNEGSVNDVDGTWGQYTIQEGENDLFLLNRRNGKKYRFMLEEV